METIDCISILKESLVLCFSQCRLSWFWSTRRNPESVGTPFVINFQALRLTFRFSEVTKCWRMEGKIVSNKHEQNIRFLG